MQGYDSAEQLIASVWPVSRETRQRLQIYADLLRQWQKRINLVAPSTLDETWRRHIADSVQTLAAAPDAKNWIDIGSGAGFPGLVTAILLAENGTGRVDLIESAGKKCAFMRTVVRETGIREAGIEVNVHNERIENALSGLPKPNAVSARALASLKDLLTMTAGLLSDGTVGVFAKGRDHATEIAEARQNWDFDCVQHDSFLGDGSVLLTIIETKRRES